MFLPIFVIVTLHLFLGFIGYIMLRERCRKDFIWTVGDRRLMLPISLAFGIVFLSCMLLDKLLNNEDEAKW